jgi:hypothetical protein
MREFCLSRGDTMGIVPVHFKRGYKERGQGLNGTYLRQAFEVPDVGVPALAGLF